MMPTASPGASLRLDENPSRPGSRHDDGVTPRPGARSIPATSFCEPHDGRKPSTWHWFALQGSEPRPLFAFAGLWTRWQGPIKKDGPNVDIDVFSFMTTEPNALTQSINHERSPVLLSDQVDMDAWMIGPEREARQLLKPFPAERMRIVQEGLEKRDLLQ